MYFELDEFLATLKGLTREQSCKIITLKQDELMFEVSQSKAIRGKTEAMRSFKSEITFLHNLGIELECGVTAKSSGIDRLRMDNVLGSLRN